MTTLTFTAQDLKRIVKTIAPGASRDEHRRILTAVELRVSADDTTWTATDSYQLRTLTARPDKIDGDTTTVLIPAAWLLRWARTPTVRGDIARLRIDGPAVSIDLDGETWTTNLIAGNYPNWESFMDNTGTTESEFAAAVNPQKLAQVLAAAAQWGGDTPMQVESLDGLKPCRFTVDVRDRGRLRLLLMPVRMPDDQRVRKVAA